MCSTGANFRNARRCSIERCSVSLLVGVDRVPLVDRDHDRAAALEDVAGDVRVLVGDALGRVEQQQHDVGIGDRLQRLDDRELLDRLEHLALAAQARRCRSARSCWPSRSNGTRIASRVVPGWSNATRRSSPSQVLISVDLPTFGRPATARRIGAPLVGLGLVVLVRARSRRAPPRAGCGCPARAPPRPGAARRGRARRTRPAAATRSCPRPC